MISARNILDAANGHGLSVPPELAEQAARLTIGLAARSPAASLSDRAPSTGEFPDVVCEIFRTPLQSGQLAGKTIAIKDNIAVAGTPTALGSGFPGFVPSRDATIVERLLAAGASLIAKAQCEAFLLGANSFTSRPAPVPNPIDARRSAGGSSSGSASLVARGACDAAIGTDSGGSIRIPAAYCGVVGFKPSRGIVPYTGIAPLEPFLEVAGPIGKTVADIAALFAVISGADGLDCRAAWGAAPATSRPENFRPPRLAVLASAFDSLAPDMRAAFERALGKLRTDGVCLDAVETAFLDRANAAHLVIYTIGQARTLLHDQSAGPLATSLPDGWQAWWAGLDRSKLPPALSLVLALGAAWAGADPAAYRAAQTDAATLARDLDALLSGFDALLLPTVAGIAPLLPVGAPSLDEIFGDTRLTAPFNVTGHPAISFPAGLVEEMPIALQLVGRRGDDRALLTLARKIARIVFERADEESNGGFGP